MQFYFIRHAQSSNNALWDRTGSSRGRSHDPEITEVGRIQACALAEYLAAVHPTTATDGYGRSNQRGYQLTHLYSSLMLRAIQTGSIVAERLGLPLDVWVDIHEAGGIYLEDEETGEISGKPGVNRHFLTVNYPIVRLPDLPMENGWWNGGMESREEARKRARNFIQELLRRHGDTDDCVAIISHGAFYHHMLFALLEIPEEKGIWFQINNCAITRIDFVDETMIAYMNRTNYLKPELVT